MRGGDFSSYSRKIFHQFTFAPIAPNFTHGVVEEEQVDTTG
jgi:hypothetical protein